MKAAQELNAIVQNKLRDGTAALAAWTSARHVERTPRRAGSQKSGVNPPAPGGGSGGSETTGGPATSSGS